MMKNDFIRKMMKIIGFAEKTTQTTQTTPHRHLFGPGLIFG
jgi:hypothetical protein